MSTRVISASEFKARCLAMLDEVAETGEEIVVTKRGQAVARVVSAAARPTLRGSVTYHVSDDELLRPIEVDWDAASD